MIIKTCEINPATGAKLDCYIKNPVRLANAVYLSPAVLLFPGGGYMFCEAHDYEEMAMEFVAKGFSAFILTYSVGKHAVFPGALVEASKAMKIIRDNAGEWHINPDKVIVAGASAGGHVAACLGTMWHRPEIQELAGVKGEENKPGAMLLQAAVISCKMRTANGVEKIMCEDFVDEKTPPAFIVHCENDNLVSVEQSLRFANAMAIRERPFNLHIYDNGGHIAPFSTGRTVDDAGRFTPSIYSWLDQFIEWFWSYFGREEPTVPGIVIGELPLGNGARATPKMMHSKYSSAPL